MPVAIIMFFMVKIQLGIVDDILYLCKSFTKCSLLAQFHVCVMKSLRDLHKKKP